MKHTFIIIILIVCSNALYAKGVEKPISNDSIAPTSIKTDSLKNSQEAHKASRRNPTDKKNELSTLKKANTNLTLKVDSLISELDSLQIINDSLNLKCDNLTAQNAELQLDIASKEREYDASLKRQADDYNKKVEQSAKMADLAKNKRLSLIIMQSAFQVRYNSEYIDDILNSIEIFGYSQTFPEDYMIFQPLLRNYDVYRKELYGFINEIYLTLKNRPTANIQVLHNSFESKLANSQYYKESAHGGSFPTNKKIVYLDRVIDDTRILFSQPAKCTDASFEKLLKRLE